MTTYYTSDLHISHGFVAKLRGFGEDIKAHNESIVSSINKHVQRDDKLWILGDISLQKVTRYSEFYNQINCKNVYIVLGNHDTAHPMMRGWEKQWAELNTIDKIKFIGTEATVRHNGNIWRLAHHPYVLDHTDNPRNMSWRPQPDPRQILIHGHIHTTQAITQDGIHVGWDAWKKPVKEFDIEMLVNVYKANNPVYIDHINGIGDTNYPL